MSVTFRLSSPVHKRCLFERINRRYVFSRCFPPVTSMFCVLFSVVLTDVIVTLLSLLYATLVCIFPQCWIS
jgi:ABC-type antimicrobial peptide transport system permease subunit